MTNNKRPLNLEDVKHSSIQQEEDIKEGGQ